MRILTSRRSVLLGLAFMAATTLVACGGSDASGTATESASEQTIAGADVVTETVAKTDTPTDAAAATELDGSWQITSGSEAGYRVPEVLNGQKSEGVGRTSGVTGSLTVVGTKVTSTQFVFDLTKLASDSGKRDSQVQGRIMETAKFPTATFELTEPIDFGKVPADKETVTIPAKGTLTVHGTTKPVELSLDARLNGSNIEVLGAYELTFADFGILDPSFKPFVEVGEKGFIEWLLVFEKAA